MFAAHNQLETLAGLRKPVLYPGIYPWFVLVAAMDIFTTWVILRLGGSEVNPIAAMAIGAAGVLGMVQLKFIAVTVVMLVCEYVGRCRFGTGRRLAVCSVAVNCFPVAVALAQLAVYAADQLGPGRV